MAERTATNVEAAFDILLETVEEEIALANRGVGPAAERGDYERARQALERAEQMTTVRQRLAGLRDEWERSFGGQEEADEEEDEATRAARRDLGRLQRGRRTPEFAFRLPILQVLQQMGGSGKVNEVVNRVGKAMHDSLKSVDFEPLASEPNEQRWRNTAQWARLQLVEEGLLKDGSKRGTWEISDKGREFLSSNGSGNGKVAE